MSSGKTFQQLQAQFKELTANGIEDQMDFFLKSFIFALEDNWKEVARLAETFKKYTRNGGEGRDDLNVVQAADFLQKNGLERTALQRTEELKDIDLDNNGRICFVEYLLLHYKIMILSEYYKRTGEKSTEDFSKGGIGITGVGFKLLDELFTLPMGLDPELIKAIDEFTAKKKAREAKIDKFQATISKYGADSVQGKTATHELKVLEVEDKTDMNRVEITLEAAKKRSSKSSGEEALQQKKKTEEDEAKRKRDEGRNKLKNMAAAWEQK